MEALVLEVEEVVVVFLVELQYHWPYASQLVKSCAFHEKLETLSVCVCVLCYATSSPVIRTDERTLRPAQRGS